MTGGTNRAGEKRAEGYAVIKNVDWRINPTYLSESRRIRNERRGAEEGRKQDLRIRRGRAITRVTDWEQLIEYLNMVMDSLFFFSTSHTFPRCAFRKERKEEPLLPLLSINIILLLHQIIYRDVFYNAYTFPRPPFLVILKLL